MSIRIMVELWDKSIVKGGALLVALALADKADNDTRDCWPGIDGVAKRTRLSRRQVIRCIKDLVDNGILEVRRNGSSLGTNLYQFTPAEQWRSAIMSPPQNATDVTFATGRCDISGNSDVTPMSPKPSEEPSEEPSDSCHDLFPKHEETQKAKISTDEMFDSWWSIYPTRPNNPKKPARAKFVAALKKVPFTALMEATRQFAASRNGEDPTYTPMATTWLGQERWTVHASQTGARRMNPADPMEGIPEKHAQIIRMELDPELRDKDARAYWARREAAE